MAVTIPFPLPATGFALNSKVRVNLDFIVSKFNEFNTGSATWDAVYIGTGGSINGALTLYNSTNGFYTTLQSGVATANQTYTLPTAVPAVSGSLHSTNGGTLSWEQSVKTTDSPTFAGLTISGSSIRLSSFTSGGILYADGLGDIQQLGFDSGKIITSGAASYVYRSLTGTSNQITITPSAGAFTFSTPQDLATTSTVDFARVRLNSAGSATTPELVIYKSPSATNTGLYSTGSDIRFATAGTYAGVFDGTDFAVVQDIRAGRNFILEGAGGNITIANGASGGSYTLTLPVDDGTTGQSLITNGSGVLSWGTPAGTGANTTLSNLTDTVAINKNLNNFSAGTITASLTGAASLNLLLTGGTLTGHLTMASTKNIVLTDGTTNTLTLAAPASVTSYTLTLPANDGDANQVLTTNGSGVTSWTTPSSGANTALSNLASVAINTALVSDTDNTDDLGTSSIGWRRLYVNAGTAAAPSITFKEDTDLGIYRSGANELAVMVGSSNYGAIIYGTGCNFYASNTEILDIRTQGALTIAGTAASPSFSFLSDTNTGMSAQTADTLVLSTASQAAVSISPSGEVTQPLQPSFLVKCVSTQTDVTGDGTGVNIVFGTETYDQGGDFSSNTFTAPVTGRYLLTCNVLLFGLSTANHSDAQARIVTSNQRFANYIADIPTSAVDRSFQFSVIADMDASDTAYVDVVVNGTSKVVDIYGNGEYTNFSGSLLN